MKTEARKMAEKMSKSKKNEDINELAREINRGGKPRGISSDIPAGVREKLMEKERESLFKGEGNKYAKGGAVKQGRRFGEEKPVQRNKDNEPGDRKPHRSPGQSNANRRLASVLEDVGISSKRDVERVVKGLTTEEKDKLIRGSQTEAAKRAAMRLGSRAVYLGGAAGTGIGVGLTAKALADSVKENRERRRAQEEYEDALNKSDVSMKREDVVGLAKGGMSTKQEAKVGKVMKEFKAGSLHSGKGGKVVKSPKQAVAIALSEARRAKK